MILFAALTTLGCMTAEDGPVPSRGDLRLATFNIHYLSLRNDRTDWDRRKWAVSDALKEIDADLLLFQEMETFAGGHSNDTNIQLDWVLEKMDQYRAGAIGELQAGRFPNTQPILYRHSRFILIDEGFLFFSPTPEVIYAMPWGGGHPSFFTWARFQDMEFDREIVVVNLHLDAFNRNIRLKSAAFLAERIPEISAGADGLIVAGDFNAPRNSRTIRQVREAGLSASGTKGSTFHFNRGLNILPGIDHVLTAGSLQAAGVRSYRERLEGVFPSDHYPVVAELFYTDVLN